MAFCALTCIPRQGLDNTPGVVPPLEFADEIYPHATFQTKAIEEYFRVVIRRWKVILFMNIQINHLLFFRREGHTGVASL